MVNNSFCRISEAAAGDERLQRVGIGVATGVDIRGVGKPGLEQRLAVGHGSGKQDHGHLACCVEHPLGRLSLKRLAVGAPLSGYHQIGSARQLAEA